MGQVTRPQAGALARGERSVAIGAPTRNTVVITGDRNTVELRLDGPGALLAFALRWNRPRRRRRRNREHGCPPPFDNHLDRDAELARLAGDGGSPRVANLFGRSGAGKTYVLVAALNARRARMRHGTVYLDGSRQSADDLLHAIFDELYEWRIPRREQHIERRLGKVRALVALEDVELGQEDGQRLALGAPQCRLLLTSERRTIWDAVPVAVEGLPAAVVASLAEQELGRALDEGEQVAARAIADALGGQPLALRQAFSRARDEGGSLAALAREVSGPPRAEERLASMTPRQRETARALAVYGGAAVGVEHLAALAGSDDAAAAVADLEARHDAASHSPRYSATGALAAELPESADLDVETGRALRHFTRWAQERQDDPATLLVEAPALLALIDRAARSGAAARDVIRLCRAVESALAWGRRWQAWGDVLEEVLGAARGIGDRETERWALNQLGTRAFGLGRTREAESLLREALDLREAAGDEEGAAVTRQNLRVVTGPRPLLYRLSHLPLALLGAILAVLLVGVGVAGAGGIGHHAARHAGNAGGGTGGTAGGGGAVAQRLLNVAVTGPGRVISTPAGIACPGHCGARFAQGRSIVLHARGARFGGWGGACAGRGDCRLVIDRDRSVQARFGAAPAGTVTVSVEQAGDGAGLVTDGHGIDCGTTCARAVRRGAFVVLTAKAAAGSTFTGWTGGGCLAAPACGVRPQRDTTVTATFARGRAKPVSLTVRIAGKAGGTVTITPPGTSCALLCTGTYAGSVTLLPAAAPGSRFVRWIGVPCTGAGPCHLKLDHDLVVTAFFAPSRPTTVTLTTTHGDHGTLTPDCSGGCAYKSGGTATVTAIPESGYEPVWSGCDSTPTIDQCDVTMSADRTVSATFAPPG